MTGLTWRQKAFLASVAGAGIGVLGRKYYKKAQRESIDRYERRSNMTIARAHDKLMLKYMRSQMS